MLRLNTSMTTSGFPNGRLLTDDVTDTEIRALAGATPFSPGLQHLAQQGPGRRRERQRQAASARRSRTWPHRPAGTTADDADCSARAGDLRVPRDGAPPRPTARVSWPRARRRGWSRAAAVAIADRRPTATITAPPPSTLGVRRHSRLDHADHRAARSAHQGRPDRPRRPGSSSPASTSSKPSAPAILPTTTSPAAPSSVSETLKPGDHTTTVSEGVLALSLHDFARAHAARSRRPASRTPADPRPLAILVDAGVELGRYDEAATHVGRAARPAARERRPLPPVVPPRAARRPRRRPPGHAPGASRRRARPATSPPSPRSSATPQLAARDLTGAGSSYEQARAGQPGPRDHRDRPGPAPGRARRPRRRHHDARRRSSTARRRPPPPPRSASSSRLRATPPAPRASFELARGRLPAARRRRLHRRPRVRPLRGRPRRSGHGRPARPSRLRRAAHGLRGRRATRGR